MILLILIVELIVNFIFMYFKFHYDSINSLNGFISVLFVFIFKFHYDSINSSLHSKKIATCYSLNSIMILLILKCQFHACVFVHL